MIAVFMPMTSLRTRAVCSRATSFSASTAPRSLRQPKRAPALDAIEAGRTAFLLVQRRDTRVFLQLQKDQ